VSRKISDNSVTGLGEALGVGLGLLIVMSVVGAIRSRDASDIDEPDA